MKKLIVNLMLSLMACAGHGVSICRAQPASTPLPSTLDPSQRKLEEGLLRYLEDKKELKPDHLIDMESIRLGSPELFKWLQHQDYRVEVYTSEGRFLTKDSQNRTIENLTLRGPDSVFSVTDPWPIPIPLPPKPALPPGTNQTNIVVVQTNQFNQLNDFSILITNPGARLGQQDIIKSFRIFRQETPPELGSINSHLGESESP